MGENAGRSASTRHRAHCRPAGASPCAAASPLRPPCWRRTRARCAAPASHTRSPSRPREVRRTRGPAPCTLCRGRVRGTEGARAARGALGRVLLPLPLGSAPVPAPSLLAPVLQLHVRPHGAQQGAARLAVPAPSLRTPRGDGLGRSAGPVRDSGSGRQERTECATPTQYSASASADLVPMGSLLDMSRHWSPAMSARSYWHSWHAWERE